MSLRNVNVQVDLFSAGNKVKLFSIHDLQTPDKIVTRVDIYKTLQITHMHVHCAPFNFIIDLQEAKTV